LASTYGVEKIWVGEMKRELELKKVLKSVIIWRLGKMSKREKVWVREREREVREKVKEKKSKDLEIS